MSTPQDDLPITSRRVAILAAAAVAVFGLGVMFCFLMACWYHPAPTTKASSQWMGTAFTLGIGLPATFGLTAATYGWLTDSMRVRRSEWDKANA